MKLSPICTPQEIQTVTALARRIWEEHFTPILGSPQVAYMLERFQSAAAIAHAIENENYRYFFIKTPRGEVAGYCAVVPKAPVLFLSKLYISKEFRGQRLAVDVIAALCTLAQSEGLHAIRLNCNRFNKNTLAIYNHLGFQIIGEEKGDIGNGFFTDDYLLEKTLSTAKLINKPSEN